MNQEIDLIRIGMSLKTHFKVMAGIIALTVAVVVGGALLIMPVKYKSFSVVTIPSRYFQQPVVEDIIPASGDISENRTLREGMLKSALNREVMESLRAKYSIFPGPESGEKNYEIAMQKFGDQFEVLSLGATSFQISYVSGNAEQTFEVAKDIQQIVLEKLVSLRNQKLLDLRDNLIGRVDSLAFNVEGVADPISSSRPEVVKTELSRIQGVLATLKSQFSDQHPRVKAYKAREKLLLQWLNEKKQKPSVAEKSKDKSKSKEKDKADGMTSGGMADKERYEDLLKRVDRLNIVLEYESKNPDSLVDITTSAVKPLAPFSPNLKLILLWGLLAGMFFAMVYVAVKRISEMIVTPTAEWAIGQSIVYLGKVPNLRGTGKVSKKESRYKET